MTQKHIYINIKFNYERGLRPLFILAIQIIENGGIMKNEILKKSIVIFFIITILMNYLLSVKVYADVEIGDNTHLYGEKDCVSILQMKSTGGLKQVIKVYYKDPDTGKKLYAFCIEPSKPRSRYRCNRF